LHGNLSGKMPPCIPQDRYRRITGVLPLLAVSTCLLPSRCIFLAVYAVKAITENGKSKSQVRRLSASSDAIILVAMAGPLAFASKHCAAYGKVAVETGVSAGEKAGFCDVLLCLSSRTETRILT
jgi:hypothetical protein